MPKVTKKAPVKKTVRKKAAKKTARQPAAARTITATPVRVVTRRRVAKSETVSQSKLITKADIALAAYYI
ncbi:MAG: hypothetical protein RIR25_1408, partial [Verrucomicrobiota bacterium]